MSLLIKNGVIVHSWGKVNADIYIKDEKIKAIGKDLNNLTNKETLIIDAKNCYILPGIIDPHVQLEGAYKDTVMTDDFYSGTKAAAFGGITTIIDFALQKKGGSALESLIERKNQANPKVCVDYSLHVGITDPRDDVLKEIPKMINKGITSFKTYMTYRDRGRMVDEAELFRIMAEVAKYNGIVEVHQENNALAEYMTNNLIKEKKTTSEYFTSSRTEVVESIAAASAILLSKETKCDLYIHHITSKETVELIQFAHLKGIKVFGETCPHYLVLDDSVYKRKEGHRYIMNPPIRNIKSQESLWNGIKEDLIQTIGTDHCSYTCEQKDKHKNNFCNVPAGVPGLETLLPIIYTYGVEKNLISIEKLVELLSTNAAKIFGLYPKKGIIQIESDADLVIYNPHQDYILRAKDLHMSTDFNPFEGMKLKGKVKMTILRGKVIVEESEFKGEKSAGQFIKGKRSVSF